MDEKHIKKLSKPKVWQQLKDLDLDTKHGLTWGVSVGAMRDILITHHKGDAIAAPSASKKKNRQTGKNWKSKQSIAQGKIQYQKDKQAEKCKKAQKKAQKRAENHNAHF